MASKPLSSGLGLSKDRTKDFLNIKSRINLYKDPSKRFGQVTNVIAFDQFKGAETNNSNLQSTAGGKGDKNKYAQFDDIGHGKNELPPLWVDIQENIEDKIAEAEKQCNCLLFQHKQLTHQNLQELRDLSPNLMIIIKESEKDLRIMMQEHYENDSDQQIRRNIQQTYLFKLQDITKQLRQMEKEHLMRVTDLYGEEGEIIINELERREKDYFADLDQKLDKNQKNRDLIQLEHIGELSNQRSGQITKLVNQINELAVVFKEMSTLVVEQGSILDRIDFNIEQAHTNVKLANKEFVKVINREKSWRARGCMSCLITSILICLALLMLKHV